MAFQPFFMTDAEDKQKDIFHKSIGKLKKKVGQVEAILYSEPFSDATEEFKVVWQGKLRKILDNDCGLPALEKTLRNKGQPPEQGDVNNVENKNHPGIHDLFMLKVSILS